jgi:hypothetical protein
LFRSARVQFRLLQRGPTEDRFQLMGRRTILGRDDGTSFTQTVSSAVSEASFVAPLAKLVAEAGASERLAELRDEER